MYKIIEELRFGKYVLLSFDRPIKERLYSKIEIDGIVHDIVPSYDISGIAIESEDSFLGKPAKLV